MSCKLHTVYCNLHTATFTLSPSHCNIHTATWLSRLLQTNRYVESAAKLELQLIQRPRALEACTLQPSHCGPHTATCTLYTATWLSRLLQQTGMPRLLVPGWNFTANPTTQGIGSPHTASYTPYTATYNLGHRQPEHCSLHTASFTPQAASFGS